MKERFVVESAELRFSLLSCLSLSVLSYHSVPSLRILSVVDSSEMADTVVRNDILTMVAVDSMIAVVESADIA